MEKPQDNDTMPLRWPFNFTPLHQGERCRMKISELDKLEIFGNDERAIRGPGYKGDVTDLDDGKVYRVYGRPCDLPDCHCDMEIEEKVERKRA